jgi:hypothetical protein
MGLGAVVKISFYGTYVQKVKAIRPLKIARVSLKITHERTDISPPVTLEMRRDGLWAEQDFSDDQITCRI